MDFRSPMMIKASVLAVAQMGVIVERMDLSVPAFWISIPPRDDGSFKLDSGKEYTNELPKRIKSGVFKEQFGPGVKIYARVRRDDGMWTKEKSTNAQNVASNHMALGRGWEHDLYVAFAGNVENEKANLRQQFQDLLNRGKQSQGTGSSTQPTIIDIPNLARED